MLEDLVRRHDDVAVDEDGAFAIAFADHADARVLVRAVELPVAVILAVGARSAA